MIMNSLTSEERRKRWFANNIKPTYIEVTGKNDHRNCVPFDELTNKSKEIWDSLDSSGYVIIKHALTADECNTALNCAWDYIEAASHAEKALYRSQNAMSSSEEDLEPEVVRRHLPATHSSSLWPRCVEGGILPFYGSGQSSFSWFVRSLPNIIDIFSTLYNVKQQDLISSMDGIVLWSSSRLRTESGWFHVDQNPITKPDFACIQGLVNLLPVTPCTGGNVLVQKSHKLFPSHYLSQEDPFYMQRLEELEEGEDWMEIHAGDDIVLRQENIIACLLEPGDVLLWDSRVVHCSFSGNSSDDKVQVNQSANRKNYFSSSHGLIRAASLVSMMPKSFASEETLKQRHSAVDRGRTLTHWVNKVSLLGEERSEEMEKEEFCVEWIRKHYPGVILTNENLTSEQKNLVG